MMSQDKKYRREHEIIRDEKPRPHWENCPGHSHAVVGIWDPDNEIAGETCKQCYAWNELDELKAEIERLKKENEALRQGQTVRRGDWD